MRPHLATNTLAHRIWFGDFLHLVKSTYVTSFTKPSTLLPISLPSFSLLWRLPLPSEYSIPRSAIFSTEQARGATLPSWLQMECFSAPVGFPPVINLKAALEHFWYYAPADSFLCGSGEAHLFCTDPTSPRIFTQIWTLPSSTSVSSMHQDPSIPSA